TLLAALRYTGDVHMPPKGKLPDAVVADFETWIRMGAPDLRTGVVAGPRTIDLAKGRQLWVYQPPRSIQPPVVKNAAWPTSAIDRYILAKAEAAGLSPAADAEPAVLARRLYFDLIGLPPTPEEVDAFAQSAARNPQSAIENLVDRLLTSPHFGERWGR